MNSVCVKLDKEWDQAEEDFELGCSCYRGLRLPHGGVLEPGGPSAIAPPWERCSILCVSH